MSQRRWVRVKSVFHAAQMLPRSRRKSFVQRECAEDDRVLREALRLVDIQSAVSSQSTGFADEVREGATVKKIDGSPEENSSLKLAPYRLKNRGFTTLMPDKPRS